MSHYAKLIPDFGLTEDQLDEKYNPDGDGENPSFPRAEWRGGVENRDTICGYWTWMRCMLREAEDELEADNPFNP